MDGSYINPKRFETHEQYLRACRDARIDSGQNREQAQFDMEMYAANGEEYEGQYGGR